MRDEAMLLSVLKRDFGDDARRVREAAARADA
jgi:hypothetical protein